MTPDETTLMINLAVIVAATFTVGLLLFGLYVSRCLFPSVRLP